MITTLCFLLATRQHPDSWDSIQREFEAALLGKPLNGPAFHEAVDPLTLPDQYEQTFQHTLGDTRGLIVNARGTNDEDVKTYRVFVWPDKDGNHAQVLQSYDAHYSTRANFHTHGQIYWKDDTIVIAGWRDTGFNPPPPELAYYRFVHGVWKQIQVLDGDEGSSGELSFTKTPKGVDIMHLKCDMRLRTPHLWAPEEGPWVPFHETWTLKNGKYMRGTAEPEKTALFQLEMLMDDAQSNDHKDFDSIVPKTLRKRVWKLLSSAKLLPVEDARPNADFPDDNTNVLAVDKTAFYFHKVDGVWKVYKLAKFDAG